VNWKQQQPMNIEETKTLPPIAGKQKGTFKPVQTPPPEWWAEALIPID